MPERRLIFSSQRGPDPRTNLIQAANGQRFSIGKEPSSKPGQQSEWVLTRSSDGRRYRLWRNQNTPGLLFPISEQGMMTPGGLLPVWFSDQSGTLQALFK